MNYQIGEDYRLRIKDHILDNIYGQIGMTEVERKIERLSIFKRLHDISQLGLVNWIFPCALHTRYIHSLGVMHIAGEMAMHINTNLGYEFFDDSDIQIIRLAGMLHDIGHYPMSHNVEQAYKESENLNKYKFETVSDNLDYYVNCPDFLNPEIYNVEESEKCDEEQMKDEKLKSEEDFFKGIAGSTGFHHENIGFRIISHNKEIFNAVKNNFVLIKNECGVFINKKFVVDDNEGQVTSKYVDDVTKKLLIAIGEMVRGNYNYGNDADYPWMKKYSAMIQLIHSDLDADNLDYLLRDATFSGTSYGIMDMSMLLNCLTVKKLDFKSGVTTEKFIVGILEKGVGCVEQFLLNKFLAYSQMIMTKYVSILEAMLLRLESKYIIPLDEDYNCQKIEEISQSEESNPRYLQFSDYYIRNKIREYSEIEGALARFPRAICTHLKNSSAFNLANKKDSECICTAVSEKEIRDEIRTSEVYKSFIEVYEKVKNETGESIGDKEADLFSFRFETYTLSKQIPMKDFLHSFLFEEMEEDRRFLFHYYRLGTGIPILDEEVNYEYRVANNQINTKLLPLLAVEHPRSSLKEIYKMKYVSLRRYDICDYSFPQ